MHKNKYYKILLPYVILTVLVLAICQLIYNFLGVDLSIPIKLGGDNILSYTLSKSLFYSEWQLFHIPEFIYIGAPSHNIMADFPLFDFNFLFIILKIIFTFTKNYITGLHVYYLLTFILTSFTSFYVLKKYKINTSIAICGSLLFAFLPFHFYRGILHIAYSSYYFIPLMIMVILQVWDKRPCFFKYTTNNNLTFDYRNKKALITILICLLSAYSAIYYNYFFLFLIFVASISSYILRKNIYNFINGLIIILIDIFFTLINAFPYIIYKLEFGINHELIRNFRDAEIYGLKISQMLLPVDNHYLFSSIKNYYNHNSILINENTSSSLGIVIATGFIFLLFYFLFIHTKKFNLFKKLGLLNLTSLLLATVSSFSVLISLLFLKEIRSYNRISIFIAFISILAITLLIQKLLRKYNKKLIILIFILITIIGIRDVTPTNIKLDINQNARQQYWTNTCKFIQTIEENNAQNSMIFQLPYVPFPEAEPIQKLSDYEQLKPYLCSKKLHYTYGTIKGRYYDEWYKETSKLDTYKFIQELRNKSFAGILINKKGYNSKDINNLTIKLNKYLIKPALENEEYLYYSVNN